MVDHVILDVRRLAESKAFYEQAFEPLGYLVAMEFGNRCAFGDASGKPVFWIVERGDEGARGVHVAVAAENEAAVDAFHRSALEAGGRNNGEPGPRPQYHPSYYGAFVLDPDGNNIEAVFHGAVF